ncbi:MAG: DMT family transporter [Acidobacteria bacterium]|nr:DMT family transporter [Acidobacteriota bacterium]MCI0623301.1 DMT family transporter [Acidobacteriota bacterium]MCI0720454.1 DMT family transporter [Acidobacteriota bacterium]
MILPKTQKYFDWLLILLINFMWATQVPVIKLIGERLGPVAIAFIPMILSTLMFLPALWREQTKRKTRFQWRLEDVKHFLLAGLFGLFLLQLAYTLGSQRTLAANAGVITLTIPVFVAVAGSFLLNEKLNAVRVSGFLLALLGVLMTSVSDLRGSDFRHGNFVIGNLIFLLACTACGFYNAYCKLLVMRGYTELEILVYTSVIGSVASIPLFAWIEPFHFSSLATVDRVAFWGILELSFIVYGCSMLLFFYVLKRMDVTQAILGNYLLPFFISLLAVVVLREPITLPMIVGGIVILLSTLMVTVYEPDILAWTQRKRIARNPWQREQE